MGDLCRESMDLIKEMAEDDLLMHGRVGHRMYEKLRALASKIIDFEVGRKAS